MSKRIIVDSGRSFVKPLHQTLNPNLIFPAVVAPGHTLNTDVKTNGTLDALHLLVRHDSKNPEHSMPLQEVFVGDFAIKQAGLSVVTDRTRDKGVNNTTNRILLSTAMSLFAAPYDQVELITNMPLRDWSAPLKRIELQKALSGVYTVQYLRGERQGNLLRFDVTCKALPEGPSAFYGYVYDPVKKDADGLPLERHPEVTHGLTVLINIGDQTTDITTFEDGEYRDLECFTLDIGLHTPNVRILSWLEAQCEGCNMTLPKLTKLLASSPSPTYEQAGKQYHLTPERTRFYTETAASIWSQMQSRLSGTPDHVILAGGGALALVDNLKTQIRGSKVVWDQEYSVWLSALGMKVMMEL